MDKNFGVYIIESPSGVDFYHGRQEGVALSSMLNLLGIRSQLKIVINSDAANAAMTHGVREYISKNGSAPFILHLSCHGDAQGIAWSNNKVWTWNDLRSYLVNINSILGGDLIVCMSACKGYYACITAMSDDESAPLPYHGLVGTPGDIPWSKAAVAFATFYNLIRDGVDIREASQRMNLAANLTGEQAFIADFAKETHVNFMERLRQEATESQVAKPDNYLAAPEGDSAVGLGTLGLMGACGVAIQGQHQTLLDAPSETTPPIPSDKETP